VSLERGEVRAGAGQTKDTHELMCEDCDPVSLGARGEEAKALGPVVCRACSADGERDALFPAGPGTWLTWR
jgi:hypothetical protein